MAEKTPPSRFGLRETQVCARNTQRASSRRNHFLANSIAGDKTDFRHNSNFLRFDGASAQHLHQTACLDDPPCGGRKSLKGELASQAPDDRSP